MSYSACEHVESFRFSRRGTPRASRAKKKKCTDDAARPAHANYNSVVLHHSRLGGAATVVVISCQLLCASYCNMQQQSLLMYAQRCSKGWHRIDEVWDLRCHMVSPSYGMDQQRAQKGLAQPHARHAGDASISHEQGGACELRLSV